MAEESLYRLTIDLKGYHPESVSNALARVRELCDEHDQGGELKAKVVIKSDNEDVLIIIREQLELYLRNAKVRGVDGEITMKSPVVRPQPEPTPMDAIEGFAEKHGVGKVTLSAGGRAGSVDLH